LTLTVSDTGTGPFPDKPSKGIGSRLVQALVGQLEARFEAGQRSRGYTVEITIPLPQGTPG
jgi:two-component sensor histidine kinase